MKAASQKALCYTCHDGTGSVYDTQVSFGETVTPMQSHHGVPEGTQACLDCHTPHRGPPDNPRSLSVKPSLASTGTAVCGTCHGSGSTAPGGDMVTGYGGKAHALMAGPSSGTQTTCVRCHENHGSTIEPLLRANVSDEGGTTRTVSDAGRSLCYACHGQPLRSYPGSATAAASKHMSVTSSSRAATVFPDNPWGGRTCVNCHEPHGKANADRYLRAADNALCLACHDQAGVDYSSYGYEGNAIYALTRHGSRASIYRSFTTQGELAGGSVTDATTTAGGDVRVIDSRNVAGGKTYVRSAVPDSVGDAGGEMTDGLLTDVACGYTYVGLGVADGAVASLTYTLDLGSSFMLRSATLWSGWNQPYASDRVEVLTSTDGITFSSRGATGTVGSPALRLDVEFSSLVTARWVRYVMVKDLDPLGGAKDHWWLSEAGAYQPVYSGTWTSPVIDASEFVGRAVRSSVGTWTASTPGGSSVAVDTNVSTDAGATWQGWKTGTSGSAISGIASSTPTPGLRLQFRARLNRSDYHDDPRLNDVAVSVAFETTGAAETWPGSSGNQLGSCANCHDPHGTGNAKDLRASGNNFCYTCHDAKPSPARYSYRGEVAYRASAHGSRDCLTCHAVHGNAAGQKDKLLKTDAKQTCLQCHADPANSEHGLNVAAKLSESTSPLAHHDIACWYCHQPHKATRAEKLVDPQSRFTGSFTATACDPKSQPAQSATLPVSGDSMIDSSSPTVNHGADPSLAVSPTRSVLMSVSVSALPSSADIAWAGLYTYGSLSGQMTVSPLTHSWREGTGNGAPNDGSVDGATWYERWFGDNANDGNAPFSEGDPDWAGSGASQDATTIAATSASFTAGTRWNRIGISQMLESWLWGDLANNGLILRTSGSGGSFSSREAATNKPYVDVKYYAAAAKLYPDKDTYIRPETAANGGGSSDLFVGEYINAYAGNDRAFLHFDLSGIPASATIDSAFLYGYKPGYLSVPMGSIGVYRVTHDWNEGTGVNAVNNPTINGATGFEWKYHDNVWTGNVAAGDWATPGGDMDPRLYAKAEDYSSFWYGWYFFEVTDLVRDLKKGPNYGMALKKIDPDAMLDIYSRQAWDPTRKPYLVVSYSVPTTSTLSDEDAFCNGCHRSDPPAGVEMTSTAKIDVDWRLHNAHGMQLGHGPGLTWNNGDYEWCDLKPPYRYRMPALPCSDCHDPHGSSNIYHLKTTVNGVSGLVVKGESRAQVAPWCAACHELPVHATTFNGCMASPSCHVHISGDRF